METFNITKEYLQQSLLYNYVSLFLLHDYIDVINFSFNGTDYVVKRESVQNYFPNYDLVYNDGIIKNSIIENMGINSWCADSCYNKTTNPAYDTYFSNDTLITYLSLTAI